MIHFAKPAANRGGGQGADWVLVGLDPACPEPESELQMRAAVLLALTWDIKTQSGIRHACSPSIQSRCFNCIVPAVTNYVANFIATDDVIVLCLACDLGIGGQPTAGVNEPSVVLGTHLICNLSLPCSLSSACLVTALSSAYSFKPFVGERCVSTVVSAVLPTHPD